MVTNKKGQNGHPNQQTKTETILVSDSCTLPFGSNNEYFAPLLCLKPVLGTG